jgi:hypothetical protein
MVLTSLPLSPLRVAGKVSPKFLWYLFYLQCRRMDAESQKYLLTFDCDTNLDIEVVASVHSKLSAMGITPVYAVPGQLIERGLDTYKALSDLGAEFLNHGYVQHTTVDAKRTRYLSTFFYDQISEREALEDIDRGHETLVKKLGVIPKGFRTPHFGTFQSKENLLFLHDKLRSLGYAFSSSTSPKYSFVKGPHFDNEGLIEIPVTGCPSWPLGILDSFNFRYSGSKKFTPHVFESEMKKAFEMMKTGRLKRINMYADPSQVYDWEGFFVSVSRFAPFAVANFSSYLEEQE